MHWIAFSWWSTIAAAQPNYQVGIGDVIEVQVHGSALGQDGRFVVASTGEVSLPCADRVAVADRSVVDVEGTVREALMPDC
ncbi:MAG: polysaccharide biosynthesis/export family protein, partial [Myxococcota bacterium]